MKIKIVSAEEQLKARLNQPYMTLEECLQQARDMNSPTPRELPESSSKRKNPAPGPEPTEG
ncbi:MAG: hypothetical protein ABJF10_28245 [Chthoniobacter sp.]|uniref:hypothetical protein n=1 Tax=Chthoniobacter sp. TaxID=2510640 RepID=UPI0032A3DA9E